MDKVDLKKLDIAIRYIERIADGCNPVNNTPVGEDNALNNPNVIRCMYFIKEVLEEVRRNDGIIGRKVGKHEMRALPVEVLDAYEYQEDKSIMHVVAQIHEPVKDMNVKKVAATKVTAWLNEEGYLVEEIIPETGKKRKVPTEKGKSLGIYIREREYEGRVYQSVMYDKNAQEYVVELIRKWIENEAK